MRWNDYTQEKKRTQQYGPVGQARLHCVNYRDSVRQEGILKILGTGSHFNELAY